MERAIFAGGCFWCMIQPFDSLPGIYSIMSGYTGGQLANPTYEQVKSQTTGHTEAVEIIYDPQVISYQELVELYWEQTDPTDAFGQFEDRGSSYRPVIFYSTKEQQTIAEKSKQRLAESGRFTEKIVTTIEPAQPFYLAEVDHQDYYKKNPENFARNHARRAAFVEENWGNHQ
ncbi:peptide-methionine (S)-S-oxide reductase MsrA [Enterococcus thailandicus]|uniref:Peptide methionine sulfoxide reductase MsrA n=1 Tax=Enterococcus thailandicus TaxID=417368 RepID=A0A179EP69_ENTTH|nr:peptide-methionine (S)-S-oxide reductase MsrA [Enterococcus thailandicus]ASZ07196.1 peptide-methionine (S)-S-oxide reductase [Enterococcus thailandicus]MDA3965424.1 peptide-methionine (S)-S-oxide reductase MsrA [Enterococcus thailandicus]MDK4352602.1 peptide-methionine (S)-S-oxide reductase MsrA [Enterococcus thailandicus]MDT2735101.1 peptide-methionine (S)-S-oxide reductase MsrA [Enterococcus thailandicus]MEA4828987.1 peptide-methionine (S)-S-oxide reductase MsrA [Enterococcus thailandicus